jgi:hypothetical protein
MCLFDYGNHANSGELQNCQSGGYDHNAERLCRFLSGMFITVKTRTVCFDGNKCTTK